MTNIITEDLWKLAISELETTEGWDFETNNEDIKIYSKMLFEKECNFKSYKMVTTIDRPVDLVYKSYIDHESRPNYIEQIEKAKMVHIDKENNFDIIYQISHPAFFFVSKRDLLLCRSFEKVENGYNIVTKSTTHDDYPVDSSVTRSEYFLQAFILRENKDDKNKTDAHVLHQMKMYSWMPNWICNIAMNHFSKKIMSQIEMACDYHK